MLIFLSFQSGVIRVRISCVICLDQISPIIFTHTIHTESTIMRPIVEMHGMILDLKVYMLHPMASMQQNQTFFTGTACIDSPLRENHHYLLNKYTTD